MFLIKSASFPHLCFTSPTTSFSLISAFYYQLNLPLHSSVSFTSFIAVTDLFPLKCTEQCLIYVFHRFTQFDLFIILYWVYESVCVCWAEITLCLHAFIVPSVCWLGGGGDCVSARWFDSAPNYCHCDCGVKGQTGCFSVKLISVVLDQRVNDLRSFWSQS